MGVRPSRRRQLCFHDILLYQVTIYSVTEKYCYLIGNQARLNKKLPDIPFNISLILVVVVTVLVPSNLFFSNISAEERIFITDDDDTPAVFETFEVEPPD